MRAGAMGRGEFPPSNRGETNRGETGNSSSIQPPAVRIDTVGLSAPIVRADTHGAQATVRNAGTAEEQREYRRRLEGGGFIAWGRGSTVWIEASLPKRIGDDNVEGLTLPQAKEALSDLHAEVSQWVEWDPIRGSSHVEAAAVKRLDLVRDFDGVRSIPALLDGLANVAVPGRSRQQRFADGDRSRAQTLAVGPKAAWKATLYDKHEETGGLAPEGRLRFEARMRSDTLTGQWAKDHGGGVRHVVDLEESKLEHLRRAMFQRVGFDREVHPMGHRLAEVVDSADLTPQEQAMLWTYLTGVPNGLRLGVSRPTERKYRRLAAELAVVVFDPEGEGLRETVRLDYDRGTEVSEPRYCLQSGEGSDSRHASCAARR